MFCPECRSEYRAGIVTCATCSVPLIDTLPELTTLRVEDETSPVGVSGERGLSHTLEIEGRVVDLGRTFPFEQATEIQRFLEEHAIATLLREVELEFPDRRPHFEVHVRPSEHAAAEKVLHDRWRALAAAETGGAQDTVALDECPACGSKVPLDVSECPDCGLFVGVGEERAEAE